MEFGSEFAFVQDDKDDEKSEEIYQGLL